MSFNYIVQYIKTATYTTWLLQCNSTWDFAKFKQPRAESHNQCWLRWSDEWQNWSRYMQNKWTYEKLTY